MNQVLCRFCQTPLEHTFVDLGMSPVANDYVSPEKEQSMEPFYPLHVFICKECFLVQLPTHRLEHEIFTDEYAYFSSYSTSWLEHAKKYTDEMTSRFGLNQDSLVIEVASNDGYLLQYFKEKNVPVLGIEPTANTAAEAEKKGITSLVEFFGADVAEKLVSQGKQADLLLGNNVLAHVPDLNDFVKGMKILLKPSGVITMEFPHLQRLIELNQFDTIYHEHYSYYSFLTVEKIFAHHGITLFDVQQLNTHGGSLRIFGKHSDNTALEVTSNVEALKAQERAAGLDQLSTYDSYNEKVKETKRSFLEFLIKAKREGKTIVGYGAPAKGNTFLNYCGVRRDFIDYTVDMNPHKQGRFLPGVHIPIVSPEKYKETKPDYVVILPWNLKEEITQQHAYIKEWGGQFVVAVPETQVLS